MRKFFFSMFVMCAVVAAASVSCVWSADGKSAAPATEELDSLLGDDTKDAPVTIEELKKWLKESVGMEPTKQQLTEERGFSEAKKLYDKLEIARRFPGQKYAQQFLGSYMKSFKTAEKARFKQMLEGIRESANKTGTGQKKHWYWLWLF
ncbi:MAG: hypothetical protein PHN74_01525 [Candidatus Pacebacteria bacterium]|nr:hypothetical protein [Candidatus Paceibacterota bacterium]